MADSTQTNQAKTAEAKPAEQREVKIDLRSLLLDHLWYFGGTYGLLPENFCRTYLGYGEAGEALVRKVLDSLVAEGIVVISNHQVGTAGTTANFYVLAPGVKFIPQLS